jgi:Fur family ferric uptake transcriptional regulator
VARTSKDEVLETLRAEGKRITPQRSLLLDVIRRSKGHLGADQIYHLARERDPRISLSTVYRNLNLLKELGLISRLHLDEEHHHYELKDAANHYHLICSSCGRVIEFDSSLVEQLMADVSAEKDFVVERLRIDLTGLCVECRDKGN